MKEQVILLMISSCEKWHYTAVARLSGLLRGVTYNHHGDILLFKLLSCV